MEKTLNFLSKIGSKRSNLYFGNTDLELSSDDFGIISIYNEVLRK